MPDSITGEAAPPRELIVEVATAILYCLLAIGLLGPLASNTVFPQAPDHLNHTAIVVQARMALEEGQFPLRVAPWQHEGMRYPLFQFYASTPYFFTALVYKFITPANPWEALKITYFFLLVLAGWFTCRMSLRLGVSAAVARLSGMIYMTLPYILVNIHARGAFTEAFAQLFLPVLLYLHFLFFSRATLARTAGIGLAWFVLATSHLITFVYTVCFLAFLALLFMTLRSLAIRCLLGFCLAFCLGVGLAAFQLAPVLMTQSLAIRADLGSIFESNWLTPLASLLSITATLPEPAGDRLKSVPFLSLNIGLTVICGIAGYTYLHLTKQIQQTPAFRRRVIALLVACGVAFVCAWSPVDFWRFVPRELRIAQFSYRFITFVEVPGVILATLLIEELIRRLGFSVWISCFLFLLAIAGFYLPAMPPSAGTLESIRSAPDAGYGSGAYLYTDPAGKGIAAQQFEDQLRRLYTDGWLIMDKYLSVPRDYLIRSEAELFLKGRAAPVQTGTRTLVLMANGKPTERFSLREGAFEIAFPASRLLAASSEQNISIGFTSDSWFVPHEVNPKSTDVRRLWIQVDALRFVPRGASRLQTADPPRAICAVQGAEVACDIQLDSDRPVQIPVLYYPDLLSLTVNGVDREYQSSTYGAYYWVQVDGRKGMNEIRCKFSGSRSGNMISLISVLLTIGLVVASCWSRARSQHHANNEI